MLTGYEQVRSLAAALAGDLAAADNVQLVLPETGVCSGPPVGIETETSAGCYGGPAPAGLRLAACRCEGQRNYGQGLRLRRPFSHGRAGSSSRDGGSHPRLCGLDRRAAQSARSDHHARADADIRLGHLLLPPAVLAKPIAAETELAALPGGGRRLPRAPHRRAGLATRGASHRPSWLGRRCWVRVRCCLRPGSPVSGWRRARQPIWQLGW